jgi:hypothetical protein
MTCLTHPDSTAPSPFAHADRAGKFALSNEEEDLDQRVLAELNNRPAHRPFNSLDKVTIGGALFLVRLGLATWNTGSSADIIHKPV